MEHGGLVLIVWFALLVQRLSQASSHEFEGELYFSSVPHIRELYSTTTQQKFRVYRRNLREKFPGLHSFSTRFLLSPINSMLLFFLQENFVTAYCNIHKFSYH